ncbi:hypothetical protein P8452_27771 [Trifolium repens]|nr:hypothetical protein P8452_27771 [Trifolium repens]
MGNLKILRSSMVQLLIDQCVLINQLEWEKKNQLEWLFFAEELACGSTVECCNHARSYDLRVPLPDNMKLNTALK